MSKLIDLTGETFGMLKVLGREDDHICKSGQRKVAWKCVCDCGREVVVTSANLRNGHNVSCGCMNVERMRIVGKRGTHKMIHTRIYRIWSGMKARCNDNNNEHYGGKGVSVCPEWAKSFENFYEWAIKNGYDDSLTIDRINGDGNYEPSNCRWATYSEQNRNRRKYTWHKESE